MTRASGEPRTFQSRVSAAGAEVSGSSTSAGVSVGSETAVGAVVAVGSVGGEVGSGASVIPPQAIATRMTKAQTVNAIVSVSVRRDGKEENLKIPVCTEYGGTGCRHSLAAVCR